MEYIDLIKKYWKNNEDNPLNVSITCIYLFLLECWHRNDKQDFELSDTEIAFRLKISRTTIKSSKQVLRNLGLISYQITNGFPAIYKIITDYNINRKAPTSKESDKVVAEKKTTKTAPDNRVVIEPKKIATTFEVPVKVEKEVVETPVVLPKSKKAVETPSEVVPTNSNLNIPSFEDVLEFAQTLEKYDPAFESQLRNKYLMWKDKGWKTYNGIPISNWRQIVENSLQYLKLPRNNLFDIPKINRPKSTYNE